MTATVPLSPQWKEAIRINSDAEIDASRPHILLVSQYTRGIENLPVDKQTIQLLVFKNGKVMEENEKLTNKKGTADFVFVAEQSGTYTLMVINKSDTSPFIVKSATFSL